MAARNPLKLLMPVILCRSGGTWRRKRLWKYLVFRGIRLVPHPLSRIADLVFGIAEERKY